VGDRQEVVDRVQLATGLPRVVDPGDARADLEPERRVVPQRKDYPLGGIPVEYKGGTVPPPDQRRSYS